MVNHQSDVEGHSSHHVEPISLYIIVFAVLVFLTLVTVGAYQIHLGPWNLIVAVVIATIKASLVLFYFMHMKYEAKFNVLVLLSSILFGGIFLAYTLNDTANRGKVDEYNGAQVDPATGKRAYGSHPGT